MTSPMVQWIKNPLAMQETQEMFDLWVGRPLEEGVAITRVFLTAKSHRQRSLVDHKESDILSTWHTTFRE